MNIVKTDYGKEKVQEKYVVECICWTGSGWADGGILSSHYVHEGYGYATVADKDRGYPIRYFDTLVECNEFITEKSESTLTYHGLAYWQYEAGIAPYDAVAIEKKFNGAYDKQTKVLIECDFGSHYTAIRYLLWDFLIREGHVDLEFIFNNKERCIRFQGTSKISSFKLFLSTDKAINSSEVDLNDMTLDYFKEYLFEYRMDAGSTKVVLDIPEEFHKICDQYIEKNMVINSLYSVDGKKVGGKVDSYK